MLGRGGFGVSCWRVRDSFGLASDLVGIIGFDSLGSLIGTRFDSICGMVWRAVLVEWRVLVESSPGTDGEATDLLRCGLYDCV